MGFFSSVLIRLKGFFLQAGDDIVSGSTSSIKATYRTIEEQEIKINKGDVFYLFTGVDGGDGNADGGVCGHVLCGASYLVLYNAMLCHVVL